MMTIPVKAEGTLPGGNQVDGLKDLKTYLIEERSKQFAGALVSKMLSYSLGRSLEFTDKVIVEELTNQFIQNEYKLSGLIQSIVACENFQSK